MSGYEYRMQCGCLFRFLPPWGWFLATAGRRCNSAHPYCGDEQKGKP